MEKRIEMPLLQKAMEFAAGKHEGQLRKGTTIPYFTHVLEAMDEADAAPELKKAASSKMQAFAQLIGSLRMEALSLSVEALIERVLHQSGYYDALEAWDERLDFDPMESFLREQTEKTWEKQIKRSESAHNE